mgnify:CR=1 FL=1
MTPGEIRRLYFIVRTFLSYGLDELIPRMRITLPLRLWRRTLFWMPNRHKDQELGARLRLALQELGPVWIKFGQMLSTRRDLFPPQIADQLALLQDRVAPFDGERAKKQIEEAMGNIPIETWFDDFDIQPLASASIAQVHTARLKENGKEVVIKVIRPDILPVIRADMKLIYRLARWVPRLLPDGRRLRPLEVVREYEKTLIDELNLLRESANAIQLRRNFEDSPMLYVPEVYSDYCSQNMMVMERIYGIPVSDVVALEKQGTNMKLLAERGVRNIAMYDVSVTHPSYVVAEAFRCSHLVFASTTYNAGIFCNMETALLDIAAHNLQNRTIALIENGSWAPTAGKLMRGILSKLKNVNILNETLTIKSSLKDDQLGALAEIADALVASMPKPAPIVNEGKQNPAALFKFQYGLFALSAREGDKDNACVINTAIQMANKPERISISVIKANYTCGMIERTGVFNLSLLTKEVPFAFFQHFGFQSGADVDKFADWTDCARSDNGLYYINRYTNAMFSCRVVESYDQGSHRLFIAEITESKLFSNDETVTYDYYRSHIKPAPPKLAPAEKATWVCSVCGYVYEGETLPADFICPLCKHPASDFVKHEAKPAEKRVGFVCTVCGYVYEGADMPDDFVCPLCHHPKSDFKPLV